MAKLDTMFTRSAKSKEFISNAGSPFMTTYEYQFDKDGVKNLVAVGKKDIQAMIDAAADSVDINILMERFANGDPDALNRVQGFYADVRDMPTTYAELFDRNEHCKMLFEELPVDIKERFNNSYTEFWSSYGSDAFIKAINPNVDKVESEVIADESVRSE